MKRSLTILTVLLVVTAGLNLGQTKDQLNPRAIENLLAGIHSENLGLQKSSMFFAGYYKIEETVEALREEMLLNENPGVKILAALALYEIHNENVLEDLDRLAKDINEDLKVRRMIKAIYDEWEVNNRMTLTVSK